MANLLRSAKSGSEWSDNELLAFDIQVVNAGITEFFNTPGPELPPSTVSATILNNRNEPDEPLVKDDRLFFQYMGRVEKLDPPASESRVGDFASRILRILDYDNEYRVICQTEELSFPMAGQHVDVNIDVFLTDMLELLLLVQEDKVGCRISSSAGLTELLV
jgi:hypothetical protein